MTTATTKAPGILGKIHAIQESLDVNKTGYDERNEYAYFKADDIARDVKGLMNRFKVIHRTSIASEDIHDGTTIDKQGRERSRLTSKATVTFVDIEDGSEFSTDVLATGSDIGGDKATRKFQVQVFKIAAVDTFVVVEDIAGFDGDKYEESPADVAKPGEETAEKSKTLKEWDADVRALVAAEDNAIDGALVGKTGTEIAKKLGVGEKSTVWRKDIRVMEQLATELDKVAKEQQAAAANGGEVE